jgi:hypothetical protein
VQFWTAKSKIFNFLSWSIIMLFVRQLPSCKIFLVGLGGSLSEEFLVYGMAWSFWLSYGMMGVWIHRRETICNIGREWGEYRTGGIFPLKQRWQNCMMCMHVWWAGDGFGWFLDFGSTHGIWDLRSSRRIMIELLFRFQNK